MTCGLKTGAISAILIGAVAVVIWQQTRIKRLTTENDQLQEQTAALKSVQHENERLKKIDVDRAELERLRGLQLEVAKLRAQVTSAQSASSGRPQPPPPVSAQPDSTEPSSPGQPAQAADTERANPFAGNMREMMRGMMEQQIMGQLARMKTKLNLTPDQEQSIREVMLRQIEQGVGMAEKMFSGKLSKQEMTEAMKAAVNPDAQIRTILSPEQQAIFKDFKTEEHASNARLVANAEMLQMQNALGLSQEQQDQVFSALYGQVQQQLTQQSTDPAASGTDPAAWMERQIAEKIKALEGVLTPAQLQTYRQMQEAQLKLIKSMAPQDRP